MVCNFCRTLGPKKPTSIIAVRAWNRRRGTITLEEKKAGDDTRAAEDNYERNWRD